MNEARAHPRVSTGRLRSSWRLDERRTSRTLGKAMFVVVTLAASSIAGESIRLDRQLRTKSGVVACVDHYAAQVGAEVLAEGGNAIDATVAVGFALAVTFPAAGNLGGGGFLVACWSDGTRFTLDYRETAPRLATSTMFLDGEGNIDRSKASIGHWVVGVPGTVAGLAEAHGRYGRLPWERLVLPARRLAEEGIEVDEDLADSFARHVEDLARYPATRACFLHEDGTPYAQGEVWRQADLANTLRWVAEGGVEAFYRGPIASLIDAEMRRANALLRAEDFAAYQPVFREPFAFSYGPFEIVSMPPPSSGGVTMAVALGILEPHQFGQRDPHDPQTRHWLAEAQRRAFSQRALFLGDPDATDIDLTAILAPQKIRELGHSMKDTASASEEFGPPLSEPKESTETTHFSIIDRWGNAVSNTYTIEESYGSKLVAPGTGFLLNNELHDFNLKPGWTDRQGRIGTEPNLPRPGRRPLSSMTPTIVLRDEQPVLLTGSPGGRTIINTVLQVVWMTVEFGWSLDRVMTWGRQHHQWFPDRVLLEERATRWRQDLEGRGHQVRVLERLGDAHSIAVDLETGEQFGVADRRIDGWVAAPED